MRAHFLRLDYPVPGDPPHRLALRRGGAWLVVANVGGQVSSQPITLANAGTKRRRVIEKTLCAGTMISTSQELYALVDFVIQQSRVRGLLDIAQQLEDALHLGSSGLEILGAIKNIFVAQNTELEKILEKEKIEEVVKYVTKAYGAD